MRPIRLEGPATVRRLLAPAVLVGALVVAACGSSASPTPSPAGSTPASGSAAPVALTVGLGYIPSVQFAQFYLADRAGYYKAAGLTVTLQNQIDSNLITLVGQGAIDVGVGDGTSIIPAVSQGIPVVYTTTIYGRFPSIVVTGDTSGIKTATDLRGKKIGIPGKYGSSWIMLLALLGSAGLTQSDVNVVLYPDYGQATALQQGVVDAATGFSNNEPVMLTKAGFRNVVLTVDAIVPLPGPGLVTGASTLASKKVALAAFTAATLRAMNEIAADPQQGLNATFAAVPDLAKDPALQREILDATIATWKSPTAGATLGTIDAAAWQKSLDYLTTLGLVPNKVTVNQLIDTSLLP